jgi:xylan 1,4-beta-xylosidase
MRMMPGLTTRILVLLLLASPCVFAQNGVTIRVNAAQTVGPYKPIYGYFGYDEPNFTYSNFGKKLIGELASVGSSPVYIRTHFMLATGDGTPSLKFGSTNAYTEDASGKPVYDWTITDRIMDTYLQAGAKPFVEIGFMPKALSSHPEPYTPVWKPGGSGADYAIGWSYPPKDYAKWGELVNQWVKHAVAKYGRAEVESWYWEVWNEPDISYWHGTPEEYDRLYDFAADGLKRALPTARIGGPASTGPTVDHGENFLRQFLEHCAKGTNAVTGKVGAPLDFVTFHAKGRTAVVDGHVQMRMSKNAGDAAQGFAIVSSFPKFRGLPIVISESDPDGCAACSATFYPENDYRNDPLYAAYEAAMMKNIFELADREKTNVAGMLTWAFEFEGSPYFEGYRTLATNGIDKPVLNVFRMAGLMRGNRVAVESSGRVPLATIETNGVRGDPDIDALAVRSDRELSILVWNYHDDKVSGSDAEVKIEVAGLPAAASRVLLRHYRIDDTHSNAYTAWRKMGSPQQPTPEQYAALEAAGQLQELESPSWIDTSKETKLDLHLPRQAVSLLQLSW